MSSDEKSKIVISNKTRKTIEQKLEEALSKAKNPTKNKCETNIYQVLSSNSRRKIVRGRKASKLKPEVKLTISTESQILDGIIPQNVKCEIVKTPLWFESTNEPVDISIIIPLHNSQKEIQDLINSWDLSDDGLTKEIIFVSDQCPQNSEDVIVQTWQRKKQELTAKVGKIIVTSANVGFAGACNAGANFANGKYLIFLNADTLVSKNWIKPMYDLFQTQEKIGIVGNLQLKLNGDVDSAGSEWCKEKKYFEHIGSSTYKNKKLYKPFRMYNMPEDLLKPAEREMVTGCCFMIPKELFYYIGKFNQGYRIGYWEDADLNMRVKSFGYKIYFQPESKIYHIGGHSGARSHKLLGKNTDLFHNTWVKTNLIDLIDKVPKIERISIPKEQVVVYTAITNSYDALKEDHNNSNARFVAFLDYEAKSKVWEIEKVNNTFKDPNRNAKIHKILPHRYFPNVEYSLWIDGNVKLLVPVQELINTYLQDTDLAIFRHPDRNCLYKEAETCISRRLDDETIIREQMQRYKSKCFPLHAGLVEATVILRRHTKKINEFNELWWKEILEGSRRDQISFPYVANRVELQYTYFPGNIRMENYLFYKDGTHKR